MRKKIFVIFMIMSLAGCTTNSVSRRTSSHASTKSASSIHEEKRTTNKDGSTEITLSDGNSITFESGTSEEDIQAAIKAIESGELKPSQGNLNGGSDTDQSEDIPASQADSIETFE